MLVCRDDWRNSDVTKQVAVLAALGVEIVTNRTWLDREGREQLVFVHGLKSTHEHRAGLAAKVMVHAYRKGDLQTTDPEHPFLDGLRAIHNLLALQSWTDGQMQILEPIETAQRALLSPGTPYASEMPCIATISPARAAALALLGYRVLRIDSHAGKPVYRIANESIFAPSILSDSLLLPDRAPKVTAAELVAQHKANELPPTHPLAFAYDAIRAYRQLIRHCHEEPVQIMLRAKGSTRSAFVLDGATGRAKREAERFVAGLE